MLPLIPHKLYVSMACAGVHELCDYNHAEYCDSRACCGGRERCGTTASGECYDRAVGEKCCDRGTWYIGDDVKRGVGECCPGQWVSFQTTTLPEAICCCCKCDAPLTTLKLVKYPLSFIGSTVCQLMGIARKESASFTRDPTWLLFLSSTTLFRHTNPARDAAQCFRSLNRFSFGLAHSYFFFSRRCVKMESRAPI